jgi:hypothetical protein
LKTSAKPQPRKLNPKQAREELAARMKSAQQLPPDPLSAQALKPMAWRVGIPLVLAWGVAIFFRNWIGLTAMGVLTVALAGVVFWLVRFARRQRNVASIVQEAGETAEARKDAIAKLETDFKKDDTGAVLAKAQLQAQGGSPDDFRAALATLETIKLDKVLAPVADQTRAMRANFHLILGETEEARQLVDTIDMTQKREPKERAAMVAVVGEGWARSGQAKRAVELLETLDVDDEVYGDLRPQLLWARAFAYAWASDTKKMKQVLRRLAALSPQYLYRFITKKKNPAGVNPRGVHPLLEKEAYEMVARSGMAQRRMEIRRG